jgi:ribosomal protein S18 acetylase RimI-like enzyme
MDLQFKKATEKDIPIIALLAERIWKKHYVPVIGLKQVEYMLGTIYSAEGIRQQMQEEQEYSLVYEQDKPIGYLSVSTKDKKQYFLHKLYVEVEEQRKGIGSLLLKYIQDTYKPLQSLELTVNRQNYKAINFYFKNGFVIKKVEDFDIGNGFFMNDFIMIASADSLAKARNR